METKVVQKKAEEGSAKFDENGKMMLPYKENGKTSMKTQEEVKKLLDKKDKKEKVAEKIGANTKQKAIHRNKKIADASFRDKFANKAVEQIQGLERKDLDDKVLLKYKKFTLVRLMLRTYGFCAYRKALDGSRMTLKVTDEKTSQELFDWIVERVEHLKK